MKEAVIPASGARTAGPYSPAIRANGFIFVSGQLPLRPETGEMVRGPIQDQVRQIFENVRAILEAGGSSLDKVVKTTVYLRDLEDFQGLNEAYTRHFPEVPPARAAVQVTRLPLDADVEIEVVALA